MKKRDDSQKKEKQFEGEVCPNREKIEEELKFLLNRSRKCVKIWLRNLKTAIENDVFLIFAVTDKNTNVKP